MWLIFLLSAFGFGLIALLLCFIGNKIINIMRKDDEITNTQIKEINKNINNKENN